MDISYLLFAALVLGAVFLLRYLLSWWFRITDLLAELKKANETAARTSATLERMDVTLRRLEQQGKPPTPTTGG